MKNFLCPECGIVAANERDDLRAESERLRERMGFFCDAVERERNIRDAGQGGQKVPNHGDFATCSASAFSRLEWWARDFRAATLAPAEPANVPGVDVRGEEYEHELAVARVRAASTSQNAEPPKEPTPERVQELLREGRDLVKALDPRLRHVSQVAEPAKEPKR